MFQDIVMTLATNPLIKVGGRLAGAVNMLKIECIVSL
jgi:hypothetical protein